tara:strand:- start:239 stop:427 length:189 start_codon:yes stop_codon:yes gene_type:complete
MAKRIKLFKGSNTIEIWDTDLDKFLSLGYTLDVEKKSAKKEKKAEETTKENEEWQHTSEQAE